MVTVRHTSFVPLSIRVRVALDYLALVLRYVGAGRPPPLVLLGRGMSVMLSPAPCECRPRRIFNANSAAFKICPLISTSPSPNASMRPRPDAYRIHTHNAHQRTNCGPTSGARVPSMLTEQFPRCGLYASACARCCRSAANIDSVFSR